MPEQMFVTPTNPGEAISAIKAISKAMAAGQRVYEITAANQATVIPNINHSPQVMGEINAALNAGLKVITHTDAVSVPGWSGAGYIILDPEVGDGAYKISGGSNGSAYYFAAVFIFMILALVIAAVLFYLIAASAIVAAGVAIIVGAIAMISLFDIELDIKASLIARFVATVILFFFVAGGAALGGIVLAGLALIGYLLYEMIFLSFEMENRVSLNKVRVA